MDPAVGPIVCAWACTGVLTATYLYWFDRYSRLRSGGGIFAETLVLCLLVWPIVLYGIAEDWKRS